MYMSRLAALKEYSFMTALRENGFPVPEPLAQSRHTIVMSLIDAFPMRQIASVPDPASLYAEIISMIIRLAQYGLIHGDCNEFNILIKEETKTDDTGDSSSESVVLTPILIDFPQMVSVDHVNAEYYFDRDVECIKRFFERRFHFTSDEKGPSFADARKLVGKDGAKRLDVSVEASGFSRKMAKELEAYMKEVGVDGDMHSDIAAEDEESEEVEEDYPEEASNFDYESAGSDEPTPPTTAVNAQQNDVVIDRFGNEVSVLQLKIGGET
jgi:RIO kinase 2